MCDDVDFYDNYTDDLAGFEAWVSDYAIKLEGY
jgi:hypothetical protein